MLCILPLLLGKMLQIGRVTIEKISWIRNLVFFFFFQRTKWTTKAINKARKADLKDAARMKNTDQTESLFPRNFRKDSQKKFNWVSFLQSVTMFTLLSRTIKKTTPPHTIIVENCAVTIFCSHPILRIEGKHMPETLFGWISESTKGCNSIECKLVKFFSLWTMKNQICKFHI